VKSEFSQELTHIELRKGADDLKEREFHGAESGGREGTLAWNYHLPVYMWLCNDVYICPLLRMTVMEERTID
jgi:hypothetical protein